MALMAGCATLSLAACTGDDSPSINAKAMKALSPQTVALIEERGMSKDSPLVVRIFKEESELEVWKQTTGGDYALLKTYPICRWSGELGPKVKDGDRQAPEGFYTVTPGQMNPNSDYYLSFNLGYPNAFDRSLGRTGAHLMVHGDCSSSGCYAMTDEQVQEIFALGRESFRGGQRSFQVQAYPFRMTTDNMVRHRNNPNMPFWQMIKEGSDTFELTKAPPKVDVCNKRYVFNATPTDPSRRFEPSAACPEYSVPENLQGALASRRAEDNRRMASAGNYTPVAPVKTGKDGGMHEVFLAKLENPKLSAPGSFPAVVKPPGSTEGVATNEPAPAESIALANADSVLAPANTGTAMAKVPVPTPRPTDAPGAIRTQIASSSETSLFGRSTPAAPTTQVASLDSDGGGFFSGVTKFFSRDETTAASAAPAAGAASAPTSSGFSLAALFGGSSAPAPAPA
ncbi:MAG TPA: murein L,D-transpeptidase family protein, partial [Ancylobacter sp.]